MKVPLTGSTRSIIAGAQHFPLTFTSPSLSTLAIMPVVPRCIAIDSAHPPWPFCNRVASSTVTARMRTLSPAMKLPCPGNDDDDVEAAATAKVPLPVHGPLSVLDPQQLQCGAMRIPPECAHTGPSGEWAKLHHLVLAGEPERHSPECGPTLTPPLTASPRRSQHC